MNNEWENLENLTSDTLPAAVLVGVIYVDGEGSTSEVSDDDDLNATLCRMVGIQPVKEFGRSYARRLHKPLADTIQLSANTSRLAADLADEYQDLAEALSR